MAGHTYSVRWSEEDQEYVGLCAQFPSLSWLDKDREAALRGIAALVRDIEADMKNEGGKITRAAPSRPHEDSVLELLRDDSAFRKEYLASVQANGDEKEIRLALSRVALVDKIGEEH